ncbi:MAG TPA: ComF family protein [Candidatus Dormibacteraeota bacterium]|nr:ComF family protein [Candidatus Dormibacteraeota bacterium]
MGLLDLVFPPRCAGCRRIGVAWCVQCARSIQPLGPETLDGVPLVAAGRLSGPLQRAIHTYKYEGRRRLAAELAVPMATALALARLEISALTFVPLHQQRQRQRGFNQGERLALELGRRLDRPVVGGLRRVRTTPAQVGLSQAERRVNLIGAFAWVGPSPAPRGVALVDDVCTTGATLEAAAAAIGQAGGSIAAFVVLARAQALPAPAVT